MNNINLDPKYLTIGTLSFLMTLLLIGSVMGANTQTHTVNLTVGNNVPTVDLVKLQTSTPINPTESSTTATVWEVHVTDLDGVSNIANARMDITKTGENTRSDTTCSLIGGIDADTNNYTCTVNMQYYDGNSTWTVNASGTDINGAQGENTTQTLTYGSLIAFTISPTAINFGSINPAQSDAKATDDPIVLTNTGNINMSVIEVNATDLVGISTATDFLAGNFTVGITDDCATSGVSMVTNTYTQITNSACNRAGFSWASTEDLYYCIPTVPNVLQDIFDTQAKGSWTIKGTQ